METRVFGVGSRPDPEFKAGYRACLIQTGHKLTLNLILGPDLRTKNNVFVRSLASAAGGPARQRSRGGLGQPRQHSLAISINTMTYYLITTPQIASQRAQLSRCFFGRAKERASYVQEMGPAPICRFSAPAANWQTIRARQSYAQILATRRMR